MRDHVRDLQLMREVCAVAQVFDAHRPVFRRDETQRFLPFVKVPRRRPFPAAPERRGHHAIFLEHRMQRGSVLVCPERGLPAEQLTAAKPAVTQRLEFLWQLVDVV